MKTSELLEKALKLKTVSKWGRRLKTTPNMLTEARSKGRLSPIFAGNLAIDMEEDAVKWMAIAVLEIERKSEIKQ